MQHGKLVVVCSDPAQITKISAQLECEQIYAKVFGADHGETLNAAMSAQTVGGEKEEEEGEEGDSDEGEEKEEGQEGDSGERE